MWISYNKRIRSAGYFVIETLCYRNCQKTFCITVFSLVCGGLHFSTRFFNILVPTFWRPELFVPRCFAACTIWCCNIFPPKKKNLAFFSYETRAIFLMNYVIESLVIGDWPVYWSTRFTIKKVFFFAYMIKKTMYWSFQIYFTNCLLKFSSF